MATSDRNVVEGQSKAIVGGYGDAVALKTPGSGAGSMGVSMVVWGPAWGQSPTAGQERQEPCDAEQGQMAGTKPDEVVQRPLPDIPALMRAVEANEKTSEAVEKDYLYRSVVTGAQTDGRGAVKKTETSEYDIFWLEGVEVHRLVKKDGRG